MRFRTRLIAVIAAAVTSVSCLTFPTLAIDKEDAKLSADASYARVYDKITGVNSKIKTFAKKYRKDEQSGLKYFGEELTVDGGPISCLMPKRAVEVFRTGADYGAVISYRKGDDFDDETHPEYRRFGFTFFQADGNYYPTPLYDIEKVEALSVKQILKDSRIPDRKKIAAAEVYYNEWGLDSISVNLYELDNGWLGKVTFLDSAGGSANPYGVFFTDEQPDSGYTCTPRAFYVKADGSLENKTAVIDGVRYNFRENGECAGKFTGWTKTKGGKRRYYSTGVPLTGWQVVNGKRYHFNADGYADTGKVKIADCTYTFGKNGVWSGKRSKTGARPADFNIGYSTYTFSYSSESGKMTRLVDTDFENGKRKDEYAYGDYKLSSLDKQILWSMIREYGLLEADDSRVYNYQYIEELMKTDPDSLPNGDLEDDGDPYYEWTLTVTANGKTYNFKHAWSIRQLIGYDRTATGILTPFKYLTARVTESDGYKKLPESNLYLE